MKIEASEERIVHALRAQRRAQKLTQRELAKMLRISESQLSRLEAGKRGLSIPFMMRWAQALGCTAEITVIDDNGVVIVRRSDNNGA